MKWSSNTKIKKKTKFADKTFQLDFQFLFAKQTNLLNILEKLNIQIVKNEIKNGKILIDYDKIYSFPKRSNILEFLKAEERIILKSFCKQVFASCIYF